MQNDVTYNLWRNTPRWTRCGVQGFSVDARLIAVWLPVAVTSVFFWPALAVSAYLLAAMAFRIPPSHLTRFLVHRIRGRRLGGLPLRYVKGLLSVLLVIGLSAPAMNAHAAFRVIVPEKKPAAEKTDDVAPNLPKSLDDVIQGFGHDVRLKDGVAALLPPGWKPVFSPPSIGEKHVHWRANDRTVREILADIANQAGARFTVSENAGLIHFSPLPVGMRMTAAGMVRDKSARRYVLRAGHMLSEELARWAKSAGFQFRWHLKEDYPIEADAIFEGYLPDVMREVFLTYREQGGLLNARYIPGSANNVLAFMPLNK